MTGRHKVGINRGIEHSNKGEKAKTMQNGKEQTDRDKEKRKEINRTE